MKVVSPQGMKGGVGKSVNAVNLAAFLAADQKQTLFIDGDYQANSSLFFGKKRDALLNKKSLYEVLIGKKSMAEVISPSDFPYLDILPASNELSLFNEKSRDRYTLRGLIQKANLAKKYKYVVIDSRPELSDLFRNIVVACDAIFLPIFPDCDAIDGLSIVLNNMAELSDAKRSICGEGIQLLGCVLNNIDRKFATELRLTPVIRKALEDKNIPILAEIQRSAGISTSKDAGRPLAFMPKLKNSAVGLSLQEMTRNIVAGLNKTKAGRPTNIPTFTERETHKITDQLYKIESGDLTGELAL